MFVSIIRIVLGLVLAIFGVSVAADIFYHGRKKSGVAIATIDCILGAACMIRGICEIYL